jgi:hypothetical protein
MKYFRFTMNLDRYDGHGEVLNNSSEISLEDLTEKQQERLAEVFASIVAENKARLDKVVKEIR